MPTVALAVLMTVLGSVLNLDWGLVDSGTIAAGQASGSSAPQDDAKKCKEPGGGGGVDTIKIETTGTISDDSSMFTSDKDQKSWSIINTESVKGHEGQKVTLEAWVYADKNEMCVETLKPAGAKATRKKEKK